MKSKGYLTPKSKKSQGEGGEGVGLPCGRQYAFLPNMTEALKIKHDCLENLIGDQIDNLIFVSD